MVILLAGFGRPVKPLAVPEVNTLGVDIADVDGLESEFDEADPGIGVGDPKIDLVLPRLAAQLEVVHRGDPRQIGGHRIPGDVCLLRFLVDELEQKTRTEKEIGRDEIEDLEHEQRDSDPDGPFSN